MVDKRKFNSWAERAVLGCFMLDTDNLRRFRQRTEAMTHPEHLFFPNTFARETYDIIVELDQANQHVSFESVLHGAIKRNGHSAISRQPAWVAQCLDYVFDPGNIDWYTHALVQFYVERRSQEIGLGMLNTEVELDAARAELDQLSKLLVASTTSWTQGNTDNALAWIDGLNSHDHRDSVVTCHDILQYRTGGYRRGEVSVIAASPGAGKTCWLMQEIFARTTAKQHILAFLIESSEHQLISRLAMQRFGVDGSAFHGRELDAATQARCMSAARNYGEMDTLYTWYRQPMSGLQISAQVDAWITQTGRQPDMIIIDHLNRLSSPIADRADTDYHAMSQNVQEIARLAASTNAAVLLAVQLTKDSYQSADRGAYTLGSLKGTGGVGEAAKLVIMLDKKEAEFADRDIIAVKQRARVVKANDGEIGDIRGWFVKNLALHLEDNERVRLDWGDVLQHYGADLGTTATGRDRTEPKSDDKLPWT